MSIRMGMDLAKLRREMRAQGDLIAFQEERIAALEARIEVLEQKRGPGRPKKEDHKVNGTDA